MSESNMRYYCHECGKNYVVPGRDDPACVGCGSGFVELINAAEESGGGGDDLDAPNLEAPAFSFISTDRPTTTTTTVNTRPATSVAATTAATGDATTTTTTSGSSGGGSRTPINITIGPHPIFRRGLFESYLASAAANTRAGGGNVDGRESPMEAAEEGEDPGDEVLSAAQLRRRTTSQVRGGGVQNPNVGVFPGGMFMVSQSSRGGPSRQSLGQMIHQHIQDVMEQRDGGGQTGEGQQQQQQQQQQQPQGQRSSASATGGHPSGAANNTTRGGNVRVINFPSVQVMMSGGTMGGQPQQQQQQQQQQAAAGGSGAQSGPSQEGASGPANPQLPQFGMPMFFGLPFSQMMGIHGSPSDYAWGPQGLENIISQMLANLEDDGPPPTKKEKLDSLPLVQVTMEDLSECSLCSVCKDDFVAGENLVKLPCSHLYHKDCVMPWLEMHDTCPTCRFHINTDKYDDERTSS